ncbi:MAG: hypothetical protein J5755_02770, partial [Clostridia bacterium]|nr:hypothetical protein [Clostridia bacterium]
IDGASHIDRLAPHRVDTIVDKLLRFDFHTHPPKVITRLYAPPSPNMPRANKNRLGQCQGDFVS